MNRNYANKLITASEVIANLGTMVSILPETERQARLYQQLKAAQIESNISTNVEIGTIPEGQLRPLAKLEPEQYRTFEEYCRDRWQMSHRHANRLIESADVVRNLGPIVPISPDSESQVRPLAKLEPDQQRITWKSEIPDSTASNTALLKSIAANAGK